MADIRPEYSYDVVRTPTYASYSVRSEGIGFWMTVPWLVFAWAVGFIPWIATNRVIWPCLFVLIAFVIVRLVSARQRRAVAINIGPETLEIVRGGRRDAYSRAHITSITLQNEAQQQTVVSTEFEQGHLVIAGSGFGGAMTAGFVAAGASLNRAAGQVGHAVGNAAAQMAVAERAKRGWAIKILYGTKYVTLAKNLKQGTADALYADLCRALA